MLFAINAVKAVLRRVRGVCQFAVLKLLYGKRFECGGGIPIFEKWLHISFNANGKLKLGKELSVRRGFECRCLGDISIGDRCFFNNYCTIAAMEKIQIGDNCIFGEKVSIFDHNHVFQSRDLPVRDQGFSTAPVIIGNNVWLGSNVTVLKGVTIGDNCVIGANCLIYKDIPSGSVVRHKEDYIMS